MQYQEFKDWLEQNTRGYELFLNKAMELQLARNKKRTGKTKKWTDNKMERAVETMWVDIVKNAYEQIKAHKGVPLYNGYQIWLDFIAEIDFVENFDDSMAELDFE